MKFQKFVSRPEEIFVSFWLYFLKIFTHSHNRSLSYHRKWTSDHMHVRYHWIQTHFRRLRDIRNSFSPNPEVFANRLNHLKGLFRYEKRCENILFFETQPLSVTWLILFCNLIMNPKLERISLEYIKFRFTRSTPILRSRVFNENEKNAEKRDLSRSLDVYIFTPRPRNHRVLCRQL